jgi:diaminopimelate decarboxylase
MFTADITDHFKTLETPFYYYDLNLLGETIARLKAESDAYGYHVHYAFKANTNEDILQVVRKAGLGADCVSGGEVKRAIDAGFDNNKVVFAGVGKTDKEINYALANTIFCFNCESIQELTVINELATAQGKKARVALRINPNVNAKTHKYITTGLEENKFGISTSMLPEVMEVLAGCEHLKLTGIHFHIGSQITDLTSFKSLCTKVNEIQKWFSARGIALQHINVGGGLGIDYHHPDEKPFADFKEYFGLFKKFLELQNNQELHFELGRAIVGQCGSLVTRVVFEKNGLNTRFLIVDAGMTELIRPALYQSFHLIQNISAIGENRPAAEYDVVGPICESSDIFGKKVPLPESKRGDLIVLRSAGAYGEVMASGYNERSLNHSVTSDSLPVTGK